MASLTPRLDQVDFNLLINGSMDYWQRGTSFTASTNVYGADRWKHNILASHWQALRSTNIPSVENIQYSYQADCLATATPAAADQEMIEQFIEQNIARKLVGKKARLIFWVSSPKSGIHNVYFNNPNGTWAYLALYTVTTANTWQKIVLDIDFSSMPAIIPAGTSTGLVMGFPLAIGSNRINGSAGTWLNGDYKVHTSAYSNLLDNTANNFYVTGAMLIPYTATLTNPPNPDAYIYAGRDVIREFQLCQRYFEKSYQSGVDPGSTTLGGQQYLTATGITGRPYQPVRFNVNKRAGSPTITLYNPRTGTSGTGTAIWDLNTASTDYAVSVSNTSETVFFVNPTGTVPNTGAPAFQWTAESEL